MPDWDDKVVYWLKTSSLVLANDKNAPSHKYWLSFRDAGMELNKRQAGSLDFAPNASATLDCEAFKKMKSLYEDTYPNEDPDQEKALGTIQRFHEMMVNGQFSYSPIRLFDTGKDKHRVQIDGVLWDYWDLNGNHRLMAAFYARITEVPVLLASKNCS